MWTEIRTRRPGLRRRWVVLKGIAIRGEGKRRTEGRGLALLLKGVFLAGGAGLSWVAGPSFAQEEEPQGVRAEMQAASESVRPLVKSEAGKAFIGAISDLPAIEDRTVYREQGGSRALTPEEFEKLSEEEKGSFAEKTYDERFYYYTGYGTPLVYARPLDLVVEAGLESFSGKRVFDFGYGAVGHLRMLASLGAETVGTEIQPLFRALYSRAGDQGEIVGREGKKGTVRLIDGFFPTDAEVVRKVGEGFDLVMSKNVLKFGYIHPERKVDPRRTVQLGVSDEEFVRTLFEMLNPGGFVMIYNLCPKQNPPPEPYLPWADGRCPFARSLLEEVGFEVLAYNREDVEAAHDYWMALGLSRGKAKEELKGTLFAHYTLFRRPGDDSR